MIMTVNQKKRARWERIRVKGRRDFILRLALILAAFNFAATSLLWILWPRSGPPYRVPLEEALGYGGFQALFGLIAGVVIGSRAWSANEKRYSSGHKIEKADDEAEAGP
jgi:hypothetical protein